MEIHELMQILVGPAGQYLRGLWEPNEVLSNLFWTADITMSRTIAVQIINGRRSLPQKYTKPYHGDGGLALIEEDLLAFVVYYHSRAMLLDICTRIHMAVAASDWPAEQIAALEVYYVPGNATREQIAIYIAHVMYRIICS